jgi:long-chain acyl-CoA synthetase
VALACPNLPAFVIAYYAVLKLGAILVPINILLRRARSPTTCATAARAPSCASKAAPSCRWARKGRAAFAQVPECALFVAIGRGEPGEATIESLSQDQPARLETVECAPATPR